MARGKSQLEKILYGPGPIRKFLRFYARRRPPGAAYLRDLFNYYLAYYNNHNPRMDQNGEIALLQRLGAADCHLNTVFDVGANIGDWTAAALKSTGATVHTFEPQQALHPALRTRFAGCPVELNALALSDREGTAEFEIDDEMTAVSTLHQGVGKYSGRKKTLVTVSLMRGDTYCSEHGITAIDFLKVDVEGHELNALRGFTRMLQEERIKIMQFEHNEMSIIPHVLVRDFHEFLGDTYRIGKLMPRWVDFSPYSVDDERFRFANYLAVHRGVPQAMIAAIEGRPE